MFFLFLIPLPRFRFTGSILIVLLKNSRLPKKSLDQNSFIISFLAAVPKLSIQFLLQFSEQHGGSNGYFSALCKTFFSSVRRRLGFGSMVSDSSVLVVSSVEPPLVSSVKYLISVKYFESYYSGIKGYFTNFQILYYLVVLYTVVCSIRVICRLIYCPKKIQPK